MITIEVEKNELVLRAGEKQLRVSLTEHFAEQASRGTLALNLIGTPRTGVILVAVGDDPFPVGGKFQPINPTEPYKQCLVCVVPTSMAPDKPYNATAVLATNDPTPGAHTLNFTIGVPK